MKTLLKLFLLLAIVVYLVFAFTRFTRSKDTTRCTQVAMVVTDSAHAGFITKAEVERILKEKHLYPVGQLLDSVNSKRIEDTLKRNPFVSNAVCYKTPGGRINVVITQRLPLLRVMAGDGSSYYLDEQGNAMQPMHYVADLPVVTGRADHAYVRLHLLPLGTALRNDPFWDGLVEQINVNAEGEVELVPRIGAQLISLGLPTGFGRKLSNLKHFYAKVMPAVGWNKYSNINLEFENQIICTKTK